MRMNDTHYCNDNEKVRGRSASSIQQAWTISPAVIADILFKIKQDASKVRLKDQQMSKMMVKIYHSYPCKPIFHYTTGSQQYTQLYIERERDMAKMRTGINRGDIRKICTHSHHSMPFRLDKNFRPHWIYIPCLDHPLRKYRRMRVNSKNNLAQCNVHSLVW